MVKLVWVDENGGGGTDGWLMCPGKTEMAHLQVGFETKQANRQSSHLNLSSRFIFLFNQRIWARATAVVDRGALRVETHQHHMIAVRSPFPSQHTLDALLQAGHSVGIKGPCSWAVEETAAFFVHGSYACAYEIHDHSIRYASSALLTPAELQLHD